MQIRGRWYVWEIRKYIDGWELFKFSVTPIAEYTRSSAAWTTAVYVYASRDCFNFLWIRRRHVYAVSVKEDSSTCSRNYLTILGGTVVPEVSLLRRKLARVWMLDALILLKQYGPSVGPTGVMDTVTARATAKLCRQEHWCNLIASPIDFAVVTSWIWLIDL